VSELSEGERLRRTILIFLLLTQYEAPAIPQSKRPRNSIAQKTRIRPASDSFGIGGGTTGGGAGCNLKKSYIFSKHINTVHIQFIFIQEAGQQEQGSIFSIKKWKKNLNISPTWLIATSFEILYLNNLMYITSGLRAKLLRG
jgi:hypothetical protein